MQLNDDFTISLNLDNRPLEDIFWDSQHTSLCLIEPSDVRPKTTTADNSCLSKTREQGWVAVVGCADGSLWFMDPGISLKQPNSGDGGEEDSDGTALRDDSSIHSSRSRLFEGFRTPKSLSTPTLSRQPSSVALPTVAISPPTANTVEVQTIDAVVMSSSGSPRPRSDSSTTVYSNRYSNLGLLPSPQPTRARNASSVSQTSATARLASISAQDERMLQRGLRSQGRATPEYVSGVTKLAAQVRSGLSDVYGKSDEGTDDKRRNRDIAVDMNVEVGEFFRGSPTIPDKEKAMDEEVREELKAEQELIKLEDQMDQRSRSHKPDSQAPKKGDIPIIRSRVTIPGMHSAIVATQDCLAAGKVVVLTHKGFLAVIDEYQQSAISTLDLSHISRQREQQSSKPNLMPSLRWKGLSIVRRNESDLIIAYGHLPDEYKNDPAAAHTTIFIIQLNEALQLKLIGRTSVQGCGPISNMKAADGEIYLLHALPSEMLKYRLVPQSERKLDLELAKSRSYAQLGSLLSPMPSRPTSRATSLREPHHESEKDDTDPVHGLGRFLVRKRKNETIVQHLAEFFPTVITLGDPEPLSDYEADDWTGFQMMGGSGCTWNSGRMCSFTLDAQSAKLAVTDVRESGKLQMLHNHSTGARFPPIDVLSESEGCAAACEKFLLRLSDSALSSIPLDNGDSDARREKPTWSQPKVLMEKSTHQDEAVRYPTFPCSPHNNAAFFSMDTGGNLHKQSLQDLFTAERQGPSALPLDSQSTCFTIAEMQPTGQQLFLTGDEDGWLKVWSAETTQLVAAECLFNSPVQALDWSQKGQSTQLNSPLYVLAEDGTIAVYDLRRMVTLFLIPGSRHTAETILLSDKDIIISYSSGKTRVWDLDTLEFRRSTGVDAAEESLMNRSYTALFEVTQSDSAASSSPDKTLIRLEISSLRLPDVSFLLHNLHTWKLQEDIDASIRLLTEGPPLAKGLSSSLMVGNSFGHGDRSCWQLSQSHTAWRQMLLVILAHRFMGEPEKEVAATKVVTFYASVLQDVIGSAFYESDTSTLIRYYIHPDLPSNLSRSMRGSQPAVEALIMMAAVALRRFSLLSPSALKDVASSVLWYLQQEDNLVQQQLAIDLTGRGFDVWQNFIDPSDMLRSLFTIAVGKDEDGRHQSIIAHARAAVIQLASTSGAIFITTITMDILDAKTIAQRNAIMKLCVFVARKKPIVLLPSLPRLAEAVVKSLDPTRVNMRESIQQTATVILNELVSTYPAIDFAGKTQKLAVGTHEGAVIMYDLKTATRLYVLETHHSQVSAISFSPDGRRLVTAALNDRKLTVWKVGSSFSSMFVLGGPPRQGTGPGEPFKTYDFFITEEDKEENDPATGTTHIKITWPGERTACLEVGRMKLTFAT
ncbi:hypothetical protein QFC22_003077 [Naganishia vaughanmartiniae]|uniref:Uncharacterized protein n=1 Tax=Naganishia vaughanmartiniae TaxID=1424756 RepID=A0ACC2X8Q0_9TREE|nr:hypothetical protein QFC22_003077 [Naganishia vaughanmartiniae]